MIGHVNIEVRKEAVSDLRAAIEAADRHEHYDGMNECWRCDQGLLEAAARVIRDLMTQKAKLMVSKTRRQS